MRQEAVSRGGSAPGAASATGSAIRRSGQEKYVLFLLTLSLLAVWRIQSIDYASFEPPEGAFDISAVTSATLETPSITTESVAAFDDIDVVTVISASALHREPIATIAYAVSITACSKGDLHGGFSSGAAVLGHSIHLSSIRNPNSTSNYDYHLIAFVHPNATLCNPILEQLGYEVRVLDTPVDVTSIKNNTAMVNRVIKSGCCGEKEFLKLYSFTLMDYPVVVHLDLDVAILKPLDDLFDVMLLPETSTKNIPAAMWTPNVTHPVNAFFTRDYPMVSPGRKVEKVGMQGGFFVVRPDMKVFDEFCAIIMAGHFEPGPGWGGKKLRYGGYYGAAQIQGLVPYFYGHFHPKTYIELNRCNYNQMADPPKDKKRDICLTGEKECQDCRDTAIADIYSVHFTLCQKPWWCPSQENKWLNDTQWKGRQGDLCMRLHHEWHRIRDDLEQSWQKNGAAQPDHAVTGRSGAVTRNTLGHCTKGGGRYGYKYIPLVLPNQA